MAHNLGRVRPANKLPTDVPIHLRQPVNPETTDEDHPYQAYIAAGMVALSEETKKLARLVDNKSRVVDEYRVQTLVADSETYIEVLPTYDQINERIEAIIITGPPSAVFTIQLGDRVWTLTMASTGVIVIPQIGMLLSRADRRILTSVTAGDWSLELMGHADERY